MNRAAGSFKGMVATFKRADYTPLVDKPEVQTGTIIVRRPKPGDVQIRVDFDPPDAKQVEITASRVRIYLPKINTVQERPLSKNTGSMAEQLFLVGFGTTSQQLQAGYAVQAGGEEFLAGEKTMRLLLTPKSAELASHFPHIVIWMSSNSGLPKQQRLDEAGHDYHVLTYSNLKSRADIKASEIELHLPSNVHHEPI